VLDELEELEQADGATGTPTDVEGASRKLIDAKLEGAVFADTEGLNRRIAGTPRSP
jgi:hypothetical protein